MMFAVGLAACAVALVLALVRTMRGPTAFDRLLAVNDGQGRNLRLLAENGQLLLCGWAIYIERRHQYFFLVAGFQPQAEFRRRGGLT